MTNLRNEIPLLVQKRKQIFLTRQVFQAFLLTSGLSDLDFSRANDNSNSVSKEADLKENVQKGIYDHKIKQELD